MSRSAGYPLAAVTAWGPLFAIVSSGLRHVDAFNLTSVRYLASLILAGRLAAREGRGAPRSGGRGAELVLLGAAGFNLLASLALSHTTPTNAALIASTTLLMTVLIH